MKKDKVEEDKVNLLQVVVVDNLVHRKVVAAYVILSLTMVFAFYSAHQFSERQNIALVAWETHACHVRQRINLIEEQYLIRISNDQHKFRKIDKKLSDVFDLDFAWVIKERRKVEFESCGRMK